MNLSQKPTFIKRISSNFLFVEKRGPIQEIAPSAWDELYRLFDGRLPADSQTEMLGVTQMDQDDPTGKTMIYQAGLTVLNKPKELPAGIKYQVLPGGEFGRFVLKGSYSNIGVAFRKIFEESEDQHLRLRSGPCVENYLNHPAETPTENLMTELLVPVE